MILSHKYKFIFIKTHKVGGTSIETALSPLCGPDDVFTPFGVPEPGHDPRNHEGCYNHMTAVEVRRRFGAVFDSYFKFCVERHPLDKCLSHFSMMLNSPKHRRSDVKTLDDYMRAGQFPIDWHRYTDGGALCVNLVLPYEDLSAGLAAVMHQLGVPWKGFGDIRAKGRFRSRDHTVDDFTEEHRRRIRHVFAKEIELMGYEV